VPSPHGAVSTSEEAMDDFVSVMAGTLQPPEFLGPESTERILAGGATSGAGR